MTARRDPTPSPRDEQELTRLALLYEVSRSFAELIDPDQLIPFVVAKCKDLLDAESCAILLLDEQAQELYFPYSADVDSRVEEKFRSIRFPADRGIAGWVLREGVPQLVPDASKDPRWYAHVDRQSGMATESLLCAPLRTRRGTLGVIELRNRIAGAFSERDLDFLSALSGSIAVAIENARLYGQLKESEARLRDEVGVLQRGIVSMRRFDEIVGSSEAMRRVFQLMESAITLPVNVLLQGETGTGKELIARAIHYQGPRKDRPFVPVNCGALAENLLESELFGHRRGAFTGALYDKRGHFEVAHGGTIFLDEIGEMTPAMQVKLLRTLENGEVLPVGETQLRIVDVRVIAATNRDLAADTRRGRFREDLYYRLNAFPIAVPPLRERRDDIPALATHILRNVSARFAKPLTGFSPAALEGLAAHSWPGNVRELENEIERAATFAEAGGRIQAAHLFGGARGAVATAPASTRLREARKQFERDFIFLVLRRNSGNVTHTAKDLGLSRSSLIDKLERFEPSKRPRRRTRAGSRLRR